MKYLICETLEEYKRINDEIFAEANLFGISKQYIEQNPNPVGGKYWLPILPQFESLNCLKGKELFDANDDASEISEISNASNTSEISEISNASNTSEISEMSNASNTSETSNASETSETSNASETSEISEISNASEISNTSETSETSNASEISEISNASDEGETGKEGKKSWFSFLNRRS